MFSRMKKETQKGQSLIEFAFIVMFLLLVVAGIVDLGRIFVVYINLRDAGEEGVVYGSITPTDCMGIEDRVLANVNHADNVTVDVVIDDVSCMVAASVPEVYAILGNEIRVTVTLTGFPITTPFIGAIIGGQTIDLHTTITGTILRPLVITS